MPCLGQQWLTCLGAYPSLYQRMFLYVQALCFLHRLHKSFASLLLGFLSHILLMDFSFACACNCAGVTGCGMSGNKPCQPDTPMTALMMIRSIMWWCASVNVGQVFCAFTASWTEVLLCALWWVGVEVANLEPSSIAISD